VLLGFLIFGDNRFIKTFEIPWLLTLSLAARAWKKLPII
jgi:hypothetical protein